MKLYFPSLTLVVLATGGHAMAQTFSKGGQLLVPAEPRNTAASQVAVAQAQLFGSMLVSYKAAPHPDKPARLTIANRMERQLVEIDPRDYKVRLVKRELTKSALPKGALICRSFAPIDTIIQSIRSRHAGQQVEIFPPHKPGASWQAKMSNGTYEIKFDKKGRAILGTRRASA